MTILKNKIKKFSKGDFRIPRPDIVFPETNLVLIVGEGEIYRGSFEIKNTKEGPIRGLIYSSSFRVHLDRQGFEGNPVKVTFSYDGKGLKPGHVEQGKFTIVCNGGEFEVAFTVIIENPYIMTSCGKVQNVRDFRQLAMQDYSEALRLFRSKDFYQVIKYEEPRIRHLYENMRKWSLSEQAMEEFLVGIKQKECLYLTMNRIQRTFRNLKEATKETVQLTKNTWGYMPIKIHVDGEFIQIARDTLSTDDFVGNQLEVSYIIHPEKTHAGKNFGVISFETPYEILQYEVLVVNHKDHKQDRRDADMLIAAALKGMLSVKAGKVPVKEWAEETRKSLKDINIYTETADVYPLIDAHLHLMCGEEKEANAILGGYNYSRSLLGKESLVSLYYQFLTIYNKKSGSHVNKVVEDLNKAYMKRSKSWELICMLIEVDPEYRSYTKRLNGLERHYNYGANQIILYWQAYKCFLEHPATLKKLSSFEIQILNFAVKYQLLTKECALYMANLATQQRTYDARLDRLLRKVYEIYPDTMILTAICTLLIIGNCTGIDCFEWYSKAVEEDLKIAQLYEYYMMSVDDRQLKKAFPKSVYLYFMHGNSLDYRKAAILYANIILFMDEMGELYGMYREQIGRFALEQLEKRKINDALRIIYKRCCKEQDLTDEQMQAMYDICHAYGVTTSVKNMAYVMVIDEKGNIVQKVPYSSDGTVVFLYSQDERIVWQSKSGRYYIDSISYDTIRLFYESRYVDMCRRVEEHHKEEERKREKEELTWKIICEKGIDLFEEEEVFRVCSMKIRENGHVEDDLLSLFCFEMFKKDQYDKATLTYLTEFYCGATAEMKKLWHVARKYEIPTYKLSERIITQMLFSEMMFGEEEIFADYYEGKTYFRLKQAYLAYVSREYVLNGRQVKGCIFVIIVNEYRKGEELADICKIALLKYFSSREVHQGLEKMLREFLREMCEKQLFFSFYLDYPESWLREVQLYDKSMIEYHARPGSKVTISYQIVKEGKESLSYEHEVLLPSYEDTYIKTLVVFADETLRYYFTESYNDEVKVTEKQVYKPRKMRAIGRYGQMNNLLMKEKAELPEAMDKYMEELMLSEEIFKAY